MHKLNAASVIILASVSGQALADVVFYDNSDLTYFMVPGNLSPSLSGSGFFYDDFASTPLYLYASPAQNANGHTGGPSLRLQLNRHPGSGSSTSGDSISGFTDVGTFALAHTGQGIIVGTNNEDRSELVTYQPGDTVEATDFMTPIYDQTPRTGSTTWYEYGSGGPIPIYDNEVILGFKIDEIDGTRYGYVRLTFMHDLEFEHHDENGSPTGTFVTRDLYMITGWGYETELDTPAVVTTTPSECPADTNGDGMLTPADFSAWVAAFNTNAPECDQNNDGLCTPADFSAWVTNYNAGC